MSNMDASEFTPLARSRVAIVGLGLMGGSLALDLRGRCAEVVGVTRSLETLAYARAHGLIDHSAELEAVRECDLCVLASPVRTIIAHLQRLAELPPLRPRPTVVIDLGSTKSQIMAAMQSLPPHYDPVGGHPMCGKEVSGIAHAEAGLYRGKVFVLIPLERTSRGALTLALEMLSVIGARPLTLTPERHDALIALCSHLPYLASLALMRVALAREDDQLWMVASSGFRDTSRLAASEVTMMLDILLTNRSAILEALAEYRSQLDALTALVEAAEPETLHRAMAPAQAKRAELFQ